MIRPDSCLAAERAPEPVRVPYEEGALRERERAKAALEEPWRLDRSGMVMHLPEERPEPRRDQPSAADDGDFGRGFIWAVLITAVLYAIMAVVYLYAAAGG